MGSISGFHKIILSRTDNIGDVVLTLPMAGLIKSHYPDMIIYFIGKSYTAPIINACKNIDFFLDREKIINDSSLLKNISADCIIFIYPDREVAAAAARAGISKRLGTSHRWFHWFYCNKLINLSRKKSNLHESLLNIKLLSSIDPKLSLGLEQIQEYYGLESIETLPDLLQKCFLDSRIKFILHPKSKGSAREWPLENYKNLVHVFSPEEYVFYITGTAEEGHKMKACSPEMFSLPNVRDLTGVMNLGQLISFIDRCHGLVACSTGPLHIAAALGKHAIGIFPPMKPIHPGRWAPLGKNTKVLVIDKDCIECKFSGNCKCIASIKVEDVAKEILKIHG